MKIIRFKTVLAAFLLVGLALTGCRNAGVTADTDGQSTFDPATNAEETQTPETEEDMTVTELTCTVTKDSDLADFVFDFSAGRDIRILQIADTQLQWLDGARTNVRRSQIQNAFFSNGPDDLEIRTWRYLDEAIEKAKPDLIVLTGDNIYGEMDDSGTLWSSICEKMDGYRIPWLSVFGNHDNESQKGVMWQVEQLMNAEYCYFKRGNVTGNSNYNVLIRQGGKAKFLLYLLDSNGCVENDGVNADHMNRDNPDYDKITQSAGIFPDQVEWMKTTAESVFDSVGRVPVLMFYHIPPAETVTAINTLYPGAADALNAGIPFRPTNPGDLGESREGYAGASTETFWRTAKEIGCTGMFLGHQHKIATSVLYDGIRLTYGLKTGTCDYHYKNLLGSTLISLSETGSDFAVTYLKSELKYLG